MTDKTQSSDQGGDTAQGGSAGGDIKNMTVSDLIDLANQQNIDVSALNDMLSNLNVSPDVQVGDDKVADV